MTCRLHRSIPFLVALVACASVASATVLVPLHDADLVRTSNLVALGTVVDVLSHETADGRIVTDATVALERVMKGRADAGTIVVTVPGGVVGGRIVHVSGAPALDAGARLVLFMKRTGVGRYRTNALALGAYQVVTARGRETVARRRDPSPDVRRLPAFLTRIEQLAAGVAEEDATADAASTDAPDAGGFTFLGGPSRWQAQPVTLGLANAAADLGPNGSAVVVLGAMQAWNDVPTAAIDLRLGAAAGPTPSIAGGTCDGRSVVQFDDPFGEVQDMVGCGGVLAVGGFCGDAETATVGDLVVYGISEADVTVNPRLTACFGVGNLAEVMTHELGHAIGLGHSTDPDATMYPYAHFDGRGAALAADDVAAVSTLYPVDGSATTTTSTSSTTSTTRSTSTTSSTSTTASMPAPPSTSTTSTTVAPPSTSTTSTTVALPPATSTSTTVALPPTTTTTLVPGDRDGDGVADDVDACPDSAPGDAVGDDGCTVCPCAAQADGTPWDSHSDYVRCVRGAVYHGRDVGRLGFLDGRELVIRALIATCGRSDLTRCCVPQRDGNRCQITTPDECAGLEGTDIGTGSCHPNACPDASGTGDDPGDPLSD